MRIALTGATGFIGSALCLRLGAEGHTVRALCRSGIAPRGTRIEPVRGDLADPQALASLVRGVDAVLHVAAAVRGACAQDFDEPNVAGTGRLLDALEQHAPDVPLLFFSSLAAGEPALSFYASSKHRAECLVRTRCAARPYLILRPPAVYGAGDREMLPVFRFMARTGLAPCAGSPAQRLSLIHVDDLVAAVLAWLSRCAGLRSELCLHDGKTGGYDWPEMAGTVGDVCGRKVRTWAIPRAPLDLLAWLNLHWSRLARRAPMLTPGKLRELRHPDWVCDNGAATAQLDWRPRIGLADGLRRTPGWY